MANPNDKKKPGVQEQKEEAHEEEQIQQEVKINEEELIMQVDEQRGQQIPEAPAADQGHKVPVHLGQPEI